MAAKKTAAKAPAKPKADAGPELSRFQKFAAERWTRDRIAEAAYNPRVIDAYTRRKLKKSLERMGLANALVVNRRTGRLVSGHQRLSLLDELHGGEPYALDVNVVDLTEAKERQLNVLMNNQGVMGQWDPMKLAEMLSGPDLNVEHFGFEKLELDTLLEGVPSWEGMFSGADNAPEVNDAAEMLAKMGETRRDARAKARETEEEASGGEEEAEEEEGLLTTERGEVIRDPEAHRKIIEEREKARARMKERAKDDDRNFFVVVVCGSAEERGAVMRAFGMPADEQYLDVRQLCDRAKIKLPTTERV